MENLRIVSSEPSIASGGMIALTRLPSGRRASTIGLDSSTRRPTRATILSMVRRRCASSVKVPSTWIDPPGALDVDRVEAVDHDLGDVGVAQVGLERSVAEDVVGDLLGDPRPVGDRERRVVLRQHLLQRLTHLLLELGLGQPRVVELGPEVVEQRLVHGALQVGERVRRCAGRAASAAAKAVAAASRPRRRRGRAWPPPTGRPGSCRLGLPAQQAAPVGAQPGRDVARRRCPCRRRRRRSAKALIARLTPGAWGRRARSARRG